ncbi:MAG: 3',5'-cyclic-AMP phosphodiesterase [Cycloclasticus sp.]|nr:3',5'-cyclic-AMP phosphodiesterase [Cycloclasticus sp.]
MNVFSPANCHHADIKVLQISDMHLFSSTDDQLVGVNTEQSFLSILNLAQQASWPPDIILLTGDLSQDASETSYLRLIEHLEKLQIPCYVLPGNHDVPGTLDVIFNQQPVSYQAFLHHDKWLFAFLDSETPNEEGGTLDEQAVKELEQEISAHPNKHILICLHHQLIPVDSEWLDTMTVANPDSLINLIKRFDNVRGVIHGHVHQEFNSHIGGTPLYSVPSTCFQFKPLSKEFAIDNIAPGYRWLRLKSDGTIETDVIRLSELPNNLDQNSAGY